MGIFDVGGLGGLLFGEEFVKLRALRAYQCHLDCTDNAEFMGNGLHGAGIAYLWKEMLTNCESF